MMKALINVLGDKRYRQRKWVLALLYTAALIAGLFTDHISAMAFNFGMGTVLTGYGFAAYFGSQVDREEEGPQE